MHRNIATVAGINKNKAMRIARTEGHRIQQTAAVNACNKAVEKGADIVKQWSAALDGRTRDSHR
ncbi:phage minor head protein [Falcatimonas sp. MSJ-15]|uniref:phage minor head protein n=1 Tax=Falcatimonas sp. MSJ-15 TaxID=2841515 RepID=UPI0035302AF2